MTCATALFALFVWSPAAARSAPKPQAAPVPGRTQVGARPSLFGLLGPVRFGMSRRAARAASPALFDPLRTRVEPIMYGLTFDERRGLEEATMHFIVPQTRTLSALRGLWGAAQICTSDLQILRGQTWHVWRSDDGKLRVALRERAGKTRAIRFTPTASLDGFLGAPGAKTLGFEAPRPLLSASLADVRRAYGPRVVERPGHTLLDLDAVGLGPRVPVELYFQDASGRPVAHPRPAATVRGFRFALDYAACKAARRDFLDALHRRFGVFPPLTPPAPGARGPAPTELLQGVPRVVALDDGRRLRLAVTPGRPREDTGGPAPGG